MFILNKIWVYWICVMQDSLGLNSEVSEIFRWPSHSVAYSRNVREGNIFKMKLLNSGKEENQYQALFVCCLLQLLSRL